MAAEGAQESTVPQSWAGYSWHLLSRIGRGTASVIYYLGGKLAYGFGITTPDWQYAIDIYEDMQREEQEEREEEERALQEQQRRLLLKMRKMEDQRTASEEGDS